MSIDIRATDPTDLDALARLQAATFDEVWSAAEIRDLMSGPAGFGLTAFAEGAVAGFLIGRVMGDEAEIITVAVDPGERRAGLGAALVDRAAKAASERGASRLFLEVGVDNPAALGLYEAAGFTRVGFRPRYYKRPDAPPADALVLRRDLTP